MVTFLTTKFGLIDFQFEGSLSCLLTPEALRVRAVKRLRHREGHRIKVQAPPIQILSSKGDFAVTQLIPHIIDHLHFLASFEREGFPNKWNFAHQDYLFAHEFYEFFLQLEVGVFDFSRKGSKTRMEKLRLLVFGFRDVRVLLCLQS